LISVDLPDPDTPVTAVNSPAGMSKSTFLRLLPVAPRSFSSIFGFGLCRVFGTSIFFLPLRYWPVTERGAFSTSA